MSQTAVKERSTQEQRTGAMRARLMQATLDLISEEGWAQASTQKICQKAGVSRGAQTHHFPTKDSLLLAAVGEIVARYQRELDTLTEEDSDYKPRLEGLFDFLWGACFQGNLLNCWIDVMAAARTDQTLRPAVQETDATAIHAMRKLGEAFAPTASATGSNPADIIELTVYLLRGMVLQGGVHGESLEKQRLFRIWKTVLLKS